MRMTLFMLFIYIFFFFIVFIVIVRLKRLEFLAKYTRHAHCSRSWLLHIFVRGFFDFRSTTDTRDIYLELCVDKQIDLLISILGLKYKDLRCIYSQ